MENVKNDNGGRIVVCFNGAASGASPNTGKGKLLGVGPGVKKQGQGRKEWPLPWVGRKVNIC